MDLFIFTKSSVRKFVNSFFNHLINLLVIYFFFFSSLNYEPVRLLFFFFFFFFFTSDGGGGGGGGGLCIYIYIYSGGIKVWVTDKIGKSWGGGGWNGVSVYNTGG